MAGGAGGGGAAKKCNERPKQAGAQVDLDVHLDVDVDVDVDVDDVDVHLEVDVDDKQTMQVVEAWRQSNDFRRELRLVNSESYQSLTGHVIKADMPRNDNLLFIV